MDEKQLKFLDTRRRLVKLWPKFGAPMLLLVLLGLLYILWKAPILVNPWLVKQRIEHGTISTCSMSGMAVVMPIAGMVIVFLILALVVLMCATMAIERRHIEIIDELQKRDGEQK